MHTRFFTSLAVPAIVRRSGEAHAIAAGRENVTTEDVTVEDDTTGLAVGFRGSVTVLMDGSDFEPDTEIPSVGWAEGATWS